MFFQHQLKEIVLGTHGWHLKVYLKNEAGGGVLEGSIESVEVHLQEVLGCKMGFCGWLAFFWIG